MKLQRHRVTGTDCVDFFQRQVTADVEKLEDQTALLTAWCNIQGRVSSLMWLCKNAGTITLYIPDETYQAVMPRLQMFVLRDDVKFDAATACYGGIRDGQLVVSEEEQSSWTKALIDAGIPHLTTEACNQYLPQMLNLDCIGGLSFSKGCYPGQEIVARTHFRGKLKQRLLRLNAPSGETEIYNAKQEKAGNVLLRHGDAVLAVVRLESLAGGLFDSQGQRIELLPLPYAIAELS